MADAVIVAGANGAGKTTFARQFAPTLYPGAVILNVDEIQRESADFAHPVASGRELLRRLTWAERSGLSFVIETTLSTAMYVKRAESWRASGYRSILHFIELPSEDDAVRRVAARVASGGHSVPEVDIRRRFHRGLSLFQHAYKSVVDEWYHWKSDEGGLSLVRRHER